MKKIVVLTLMLLVAIANRGLSQKKNKVSLVDSLDHKLDMSDFLIDANRFIPIRIIVTEPALRGHIPPDVSGGAILYTVNKSWAALAFRSGTWLKARSKYRAGGGYANSNMSFYRTSSAGEEFSTEFDLRTTPLKGSLLRRFGTSPWSAGIDYTFLNTKVSVEGEVLPDFVTDKEINSLFPCRV